MTPSIRRLVQFRSLDLLRERCPTGMDLILCRNVIIYFNEDVKHAMMHRFGAALRPGGYLFIGATESILSTNELSLARTSSDSYRKRDGNEARRVA